MATKERIKSTLQENFAPGVAKAQAEGTVKDPVGTSNNPSNQVLTAANVITAARFVLTMCFLFMFVTDHHRMLAVAFYVIAALTDFLDGQVARRTQTVSWVGKIMDPIMDRVLLFSGVLALVLTGEVPVWIPVFVIGRDIYLAQGAARVHKYRERPVDVVYPGKIATALLMAGFSFCLLGQPQVPGLGLADISWLPGWGSAPCAFGMWLIYVGIGFSFATAVIYTVEGLDIKKQALAERAAASQEAASDSAERPSGKQTMKQEG